MKAINMQPYRNYGRFFIIESTKIMAAGALATQFLFQIDRLNKIVRFICSIHIILTYVIVAPQTQA